MKMLNRMGAEISIVDKGVIKRFLCEIKAYRMGILVCAYYNTNVNTFFSSRISWIMNHIAWENKGFTFSSKVIENNEKSKSSYLYSKVI